MGSGWSLASLSLPARDRWREALRPAFATTRIHASLAASSGYVGASDAARASHPGDFEHFFSQHAGVVSGYLWRITGDEQTASDLAQETFLRAWQHFERIRTYDRPGAWLLRVATNLALQDKRRRAAPVGAAAALDEARLDITRAPGASDPGRRVAERDLVRETLLELTPKARALLVLREVYGLSAAEVGAVLKMSREAVKVGLWRARAQFRERYMRKEEQA